MAIPAISWYCVLVRLVSFRYGFQYWNCHPLQRAGFGFLRFFNGHGDAKLWRALAVEYMKPAARVRQFHAEGKKVLTGTVNRPAAIRRLTEAGVDGMIGDDLLLLAETLRPRI
jgi:glycerophosphoryl diester phosphodiesterase